MSDEGRPLGDGEADIQVSRTTRLSRVHAPDVCGHVVGTDQEFGDRGVGPVSLLRESNEGTT